MTAGSLPHEDVITCLPTGPVSSYAVFAGFVASHSVCSHDSRPENPADEGTAETEVSPDRKGEGWGGKAEGDRRAVLQEKQTTIHTSSTTAATAWACVGTGPMTAGPWEPLMSACLCLRPRPRSPHLSLPSPKTSAACRCLSGTYSVVRSVQMLKVEANHRRVQERPWQKWRVSHVVCAERAAVLWSPPSASSDTWPCTAWFSSAPSSSSTQWVEELFSTSLSLPPFFFAPLLCLKA